MGAGNAAGLAKRPSASLQVNEKDDGRREEPAAASCVRGRWVWPAPHFFSRPGCLVLCRLLLVLLDEQEAEPGTLGDPTRWICVEPGDRRCQPPAAAEPKVPKQQRVSNHPSNLPYLPTDRATDRPSASASASIRCVQSAADRPPRPPQGPRPVQSRLFFCLTGVTLPFGDPSDAARRLVRRASSSASMGMAASSLIHAVVPHQTPSGRIIFPFCTFCPSSPSHTHIPPYISMLGKSYMHTPLWPSLCSPIHYQHFPVAGYQRCHQSTLK